jgi:hypothetical protein
MRKLRLIIFSFLFSSIAFILSDQVLYRLWLVPQLPSFYKIPAYDFILVLLPVVLVVLITGLMLSSWKEVCFAAFVFTLSHQVYNSIIELSNPPGLIFGYSLENPYNFWVLLSFFIFCVYVFVFSIVWYSKIIFKRYSDRLTLRHPLEKSQAGPRADFKKNNNEDSAPARITYHVVPNPGGWRVKKGKAKKASSAHLKKEDALRAASDVAKSHPLSQVVVHKASGIIASDRKYGYRHYKQKKRKKEVIKKIKKGLKRSKRKENEQRLRRRKAAQLGIARLKRKRYLHRLAIKKGAWRRKKNK